MRSILSLNTKPEIVDPDVELDRESEQIEDVRVWPLPASQFQRDAATAVTHTEDVQENEWNSAVVGLMVLGIVLGAYLIVRYGVRRSS